MSLMHVHDSRTRIDATKTRAISDNHQQSITVVMLAALMLRSMSVLLTEYLVIDTQYYLTGTQYQNE